MSAAFGWPILGVQVSQRPPLAQVHNISHAITEICYGLGCNFGQWKKSFAYLPKPMQLCYIPEHIGAIWYPEIQE